MGRKALQDGTAIAVVQEYVDGSGRRGEAIQRMVGQPKAGRRDSTTSSTASNEWASEKRYSLDGMPSAMRWSNQTEGTRDMPPAPHAPVYHHCHVVGDPYPGQRERAYEGGYRAAPLDSHHAHGGPRYLDHSPPEPTLSYPARHYLDSESPRFASSAYLAPHYTANDGRYPADKAKDYASCHEQIPYRREEMAAFHSSDRSSGILPPRERMQFLPDSKSPYHDNMNGRRYPGSMLFRSEPLARNAYAVRSPVFARNEPPSDSTANLSLLSSAASEPTASSARGVHPSRSNAPYGRALSPSSTRAEDGPSVSRLLSPPSPRLAAYSRRSTQDMRLPLPAGAGSKVPCSSARSTTSLLTPEAPLAPAPRDQRLVAGDVERYREPERFYTRSPASATSALPYRRESLIAAKSPPAAGYRGADYQLPPLRSTLPGWEGAR